VSRLSPAAVAAAALVAASAPAASARPALEPPAHHPVATPTPIVVHAAGPGFELGSAAIGAGGATLLFLMTAAGTVTMVRHRDGLHN
jgi:hypothetical protein